MTTYRECFELAVSATVSGATVLTLNTRSARAVRAAAEESLRTARRAWKTPDVLPYEAFVARLYSDALVVGDVTRHVLRREQELQLWRQIIEHSTSGRAMLLPESAAALASEAFRTANEYGLKLDSALMSASSDTRAFSGWAAEFERQLDGRGWTCAAELGRNLAGFLTGRNLPEQVWVFLPEVTPAQLDFLRELADAGVQVTLAPEHGEAGVDAARYEFSGVAEELRGAAQWARQQVESRPEVRVGVVFFDLARKLPQVESEFRTALHPEHLLGESGAAAFEIASPVALAEYPAVRCALQLLWLCAGTVDFDSFAALMSSPFWAESQEAAAAFVARVREHAHREVGFEELVGWLHDPALPGAQLPRLRAAVERMPKHSTFSSEQSATYWVDVSRRILETLGWPGDVALNSEEFQYTNRWRELLVAISSLELLEWRTDFAGFVERLERMAAAQNFKPETLDAPVQIMDADEAAGSVFDALWIGSCSDDLWPDSPRSSPLLPVALLKEAGFPLVGTSEADLRTARIARRLLQSAPRVALSMALRTDDEREQRWSPAFANIALADETIELPQPLALRFEAAELEAISDAVAPALRADESAKGGTSLLQEQSNCPFRAFAIRRLLAKQAEGPSEALAPTERGKVVERALQLIWEELEGSEGLRRADREAVIERSVDQAMADELPPCKDAWTLRFRLLERQRTIEVLHEWLVLESRRAPFHVMDHQMDVELTLGGLALRGRLDRLDEVGDAHVVIDYKTGAVNGVKVWQVPRPRMPQLPFYAVAMQDRKFNVAGVAFGVVRRGEAGFRGYMSEPNLLPCAAPRKDAFEGQSFVEYRARWAAELERIAASFVQGAAAVDPKIGPGKSNSSCEHCHLASLCRVGDIAEANADAEMDGGDDE